MALPGFEKDDLVSLRLSPCDFSRAEIGGPSPPEK